MIASLHKFAVWVSEPVNACMLLTTVSSSLQVIAKETGWRWVVITSRVVESLPLVANFKGLATAGRKQ